MAAACSRPLIAGIICNVRRSASSRDACAGILLQEISEHAIAEREGVVALRRVGVAFRWHDAVGEMPRAELKGMRGACRQAQLELALSLAGQVEHHDAFGGAVIECHRYLQDAAAVGCRGERV